MKRKAHGPNPRTTNLVTEIVSILEPAAAVTVESTSEKTVIWIECSDTHSRAKIADLLQSFVRLAKAFSAIDEHSYIIELESVNDWKQV